MFKYVFAGFISLFSSLLLALDLELTQGVNSALPIAISSFGSDVISQQLHDIFVNDLNVSGRFNIIKAPRNGFISPSEWRQAGADSVLSGHVTESDQGYTVHVELIDSVTQNKVLLSQSFKVNNRKIRALAHHISDEVYQKLTGEKGIFSTRIAYIRVKHFTDRARYYLEVADVDGYNPQSLLVSSEPIMSPSWSPDGQKIAYVSFERKKAQIYIVSVETGKRRLVTDFSGINGAPAWSPDGKRLAVVLSKGGNPKIYSVELSDGSMKQLTFGQAIDTEPQFSPDGRSLIFTSGRGGTPQIYSLSLADGRINRLSYEGNYNARATYTPQQNHIVMLHRQDKDFAIARLDTNEGQILPLTDSPHDESPSIAPNGRLVVYATSVNDKGILGIVSLDGRIKVQLPAGDGDLQEPAWSPYLS